MNKSYYIGAAAISPSEAGRVYLRHPSHRGFARIAAVDGHWASDVVAGGFLGWLTADLTRRHFPKSNYGFMIFGDGVSAYGRF